MSSSREPSFSDRIASAAGLVQRAVERQLDALEERARHLGNSSPEPADSERTARTLATLTRTLGALQALRAAEGEADPEPESAPDVDAIRREISERLARFIAEDEGTAAEQPVGE